MLAAALLAALAAGLDNQCKNTLYTTHWYGKNDIQTFNSIPSVKTNLKYCPKYNQRASCCHQTFESELQKYFESWRHILAAKLARVQQHKLSVMDVKNTDSYRASSSSDLEQYHASLRSFDRPLDVAVHSDCFSAILTYIAGMMCFSCAPNWFEYVVVDDALPPHVMKVRIVQSVCVQLWDRCSAFGDAARELEQRILDSALAKQAKSGLEPLYMFRDQQSLCDWAHVRIALHPFSLPTQADKESRLQGGKATSRMLLENVTLADSGLEEVLESAEVLEPPRLRGVTSGDGALETLELEEDPSLARRLEELQFDVIAEGQASGFDLRWTKNYHGSAAAAGLLLLAALQ